jgi:hypothetical protein
MTGRRIFALTTMLLAIFLLAGGPAHEAAAQAQPELLRTNRPHKPHKPHKPRKPRHCQDDRPCNGGTCNDAGLCCRRDEITCGAVCCDKLLADACCDGACVDFASDENHCGGCGIQCRDDMSCQDGVCSCQATEVDCGTTCANLMFDDDNCGTCGHQCAADERCFLGSCGCEDISETSCDGQCVNLRTSREHCGWCGNACVAGQECVEGACRPPCGPCEVRDPSGTCVAKCPVGQVCGDDGECTTDCGPFATLCGGRCVSKTPRGSGVCCEWDGDWHACAAGEQCAAYGCCSGDAVVCEGAGAAQCCYGGFLCVHRGDGSPACCLPGNHAPQDCGPGGLPDYCCLPH